MNPTPKTCALKRKLLEEYSAAVRGNAEVLAAALRVFSSEHIGIGMHKGAWVRAEQARLIYERHIKTHRC